MFSSFNLRYKKTFVKPPLYFWVIFLSILIIAGVSGLQAYTSNSKEKHRLEKLLKYVMIRNYGLYTLVGSKPMTIFSLSTLIDEEEKRAAYNDLPTDAKAETPYHTYLHSREDQQKHCHEWIESTNELLCNQYQFKIGWEGKSGIFINVPEVLFILDKFSEDFARITGENLSPPEALKTIGDDTSTYWQTIRKNHYLLGLLLGFGEKNSKFFQWEQDKKISFPLRQRTGPNSALTKPTLELTLEDFSLPQYVMYQPLDPDLEQYKIERKRCISLYNGKDFTKLTLQLLKGRPLSK